MLRLGPLVVYPVELTHSRGQHAPSHVREVVNRRGERDESQSVRQLVSKFTTTRADIQPVRVLPFAAKRERSVMGRRVSWSAPLPWDYSVARRRQSVSTSAPGW